MIGADNDVARALVVHRVAESARVRALVGGRIRPGVLDADDALPAVVYSIVSSQHWHHLQGAAGGGQARVQFAAYAYSAAEAADVAGAIRDALDGFAGRLGDGEDAIAVYDCTLDNDYERHDPPTPGDHRWRRRRVIDFEVSHSEPLPSHELEPAVDAPPDDD